MKNIDTGVIKIEPRIDGNGYIVDYDIENKGTDGLCLIFDTQTRRIIKSVIEKEFDVSAFRLLLPKPLSEISWVRISFFISIPNCFDGQFLPDSIMVKAIDDWGGSPICDAILKEPNSLEGIDVKCYLKSGDKITVNVYIENKKSTYKKLSDSFSNKIKQFLNFLKISNQ